MNKKILSGSFWLSFGSIVSRILGVVYLIPWLIMLGSYHNQLNAQALFNSSYTPYALFLSIGTAGLPSVIAREVSQLNSQNRYKDSLYITKLGFAIMLVMGIACGILLYVTAPMIAKNSPVDSVASATISIRVLVPAVVILPSMSMVRGWFQGNNDMKPYGISQLWEQFARILFILLATLLIIEVFHHDYVTAVYFSVFGACVGAIASYLYLFAYMRKQWGHYRELIENSEPRALNNVSRSLLNLWYASIPFVLLGSFITVTQLVDQLLFKQILISFSHMSKSYVSYLYTIFSANPSKITTVIISLATAVSETSLPLLAGLKYKANDSQESIRQLLLENYRLLLFVLLPVVALGAFAASPIYTVLFSHDSLGAYYLVENIVQSLFAGLVMNSLTLLLALNMNKLAVIYMVEGVLVKIILQVPMTMFMNADGAILSTDISFLLVIWLSYHKLNKTYGVNMGSLLPIIVSNEIYIILLFVYQILFGYRFNDLGRVGSFGYLAIFGLVFLGIYVLLANWMKTSETIFGKKIGYRYYRYKHFE